MEDATYTKKAFCKEFVGFFPIKAYYSWVDEAYGYSANTSNSIFKTTGNSSHGKPILENSAGFSLEYDGVETYNLTGSNG